jgi:hypothetical protein
LTTEASFSLGISKHFINDAAHFFRRDGSPYHGKPTTGLHAFLTLALTCKSLHVYGFGGSKTLDDHRMSEDHGIEREHALLYALGNHTLPEADFPRDSPLVAQWRRTSVVFRE